ncbi:MAG: DedA family protein [Ignavibacteriales bacterium]|nr:DedA family protein [Ignavibacteriales bacterium]
MNILFSLFDFIIHIDKHLVDITAQYGVLTYAILFAIIFAETGLVFTPFLPGDSLLFAAGAIAALGSLDVHTLAGLLIAAAIIGDNTNYWIGRYIGPKLCEKYPRFIKKQYLDKTHAFFEKHGGKTIIIARFMPIIRTFTPFVAGIGKMDYRRFVSYDIAGGILWIASFTYMGYFFGNIPIVKSNFVIVVFTIIFISILPGIIGYLKHRKEGKHA